MTTAGKLWELTAAETVAALRAREISVLELVRVYLDRISQTDGEIGAWEHIDGDGALAAAARLERTQQVRVMELPLLGVPFGVKDVIHVANVPTRAGFEPYRDNIPLIDATVVGLLRGAGAIPLGKTVTTSFALGQDRPKTRNPWNRRYTPGGSSSGTAAAVAARQVPIALGTQTTASLLRPACYCGTLALKPSFGRISKFGVMPTSWSSDHPGIAARSVEDLALILSVVGRHDGRDPHSRHQVDEDYLGAATRAAGGKPPRLGLIMDLLERATGEVRSATEEAVSRLEHAGAHVLEFRLPVSLDLLLAVHWILLLSDAADIHAQQYSELAEYYQPMIRANVEVGQLLPAAAYVHASRLRRRIRGLFAEAMGSVSALLAPTSSDLPPLADPPAEHNPLGDASFQAPWSLLGLPNVTLPTGVGEDGLPRGVQLIARDFMEAELLRVAAWCSDVFGPMRSPVV